MNARPPGRIRFRWWWLALLVPPVLLAALLTWTAILSARFDAGLDAIRAAGEPVDLVELNRPPVPEEDNAAPLLRRVGAWMDDIEHGPPSGYYLLAADWEPEEEADMREWAESTDACFSWLKEAAARPGLDFGVDWRKGFETAVPSIPLMLRAGDVVEWRIHFDVGGPDGNLEGITVLLDLARRIERSSIIGCLVGWTVNQRACELLRTAAGRPDFDPRQASAGLEGRLIAAEDSGGARQALLGERVNCLSLVRRWAAGEDPFRWLDRISFDEEEPETGLAGWLASSFLVRPFAYLDGLHAQEMFREFLEIERLAPWEARAKGSGAAERYGFGVPYVHTTLWRVLPGRMFHERCRHLANLRVTRAGLALLVRGRPGGSLEQVGSWVDPFTGSPLRYADGRVSAAIPAPEGWNPEWDGDPDLDYRIFWKLPFP